MELMKVNPPEGMSPEKVSEVKEAFKLHIDCMAELEPSFSALVVAVDTGVPTEEQSANAKILRKAYGKTRTATGKTHKALKADALNYGRYLDGMKKAQLEVSQNRESRLLIIEEYHENLERQRIADLIKTRKDELMFKGIDYDSTDIGTLTDDEWNDRIEGMVLVKQKRIDEVNAEAAENERLRKENAKLTEDKRIADKKERERVESELDAKRVSDKARVDEDLRKADLEHRRHTENVVFTEFVNVGGLTEADAQSLVDKIVLGQIPHLSIDY